MRRFCLLLAIVGLMPAIRPAAQGPARLPDVMFIPSSDEVVAAMLDLAQVTSRDVVYDLGCGDGKIVIAAAKTRGARAVGVDIDPARIREANTNAQAAGVADRVRFILGDIFSDDIHIGEATVVALYLLPSLNERLRPKLWRELAPGTRVVSNSFGMGAAWPPQDTRQVGEHWVYLWSVPQQAPTVRLKPDTMISRGGFHPIDREMRPARR
jgi:SAM-dependent methyltransferase